MASGCAVWRIPEGVQLVRASEPFQAMPVPARGSLLVVGDSTAVGTGASAPGRSLPGLVGARHPRLRVENRAQDGARFEAMAAQIAGAAQPRYDMVLVMGGGNDVIRATSEESLREAVAQVLALAGGRSPVVVVMPCGNVGNVPFFYPPVSWGMTSRSQRLHAIVREAAGKTGAHYVNLYKPKAEDPFAQMPGTLHAADGLHPSDAGYAAWYRELDTQAGFDARLQALTA